VNFNPTSRIYFTINDQIEAFYNGKVNMMTILYHCCETVHSLIMGLFKAMRHHQL